MALPLLGTIDIRFITFEAEFIDSHIKMGPGRGTAIKTMTTEPLQHLLSTMNAPESVPRIHCEGLLEVADCVRQARGLGWDPFPSAGIRHWRACREKVGGEIWRHPDKPGAFLRAVRLTTITDYPNWSKNIGLKPICTRHVDGVPDALGKRKAEYRPRIVAHSSHRNAANIRRVRTHSVQNSRLGLRLNHNLHDC